MADPEGRHKIGMSNNVERRRKQLSKLAGRDLRIAFFTDPIPWNWATRTETTAHMALVEHHVGHEWFFVSLDAAISAVKEAAVRVAAGHNPGKRLVQGGCPAQFPVKLTMPAPREWRALIRSLLRPDEKRTEFIREAIEREIKRRSRSKP